MLENYFKTLHKKPRTFDAIILSIFAVLITFQPFLFKNKLNIEELNLYLPCINAVLHGLIPFKDFFHLRGPLEIYIPALLMILFGIKVTVLYMYFYIGNVLTLIIGIFIAKELYKTRYFLYLMSFVFIARTFPRVMFYCWGGMRYALGLLAILFFIYFLKSKKYRFTLLAGIVTSLGTLTSIEIGVCSFVGIFLSFLYLLFTDNDKNFIKNTFLLYLAGIAVILLPYFAYLYSVGGLGFYLDSIYTVVTNMEKVINLRIFSDMPQRFTDIIPIIWQPFNKNFRHVTPIYLYLFLFIFFIYQHRNKEIEKDIWTSILCLGFYGIIMYSSAFRNIWGSQFEMALQPEKILMFYLLEKGYLVLLDNKISISKILKSPHMFNKNISLERLKLFIIVFLFIGLFFSSVGYSLARYNHRFPIFRIVKRKLLGKSAQDLSPLLGENSRVINVKRIGKMIVPAAQANEIEEVVSFIDKNTNKNDIILMYPDQGSYSFFFDRPFLGRFPIAAFSWFNNNWYNKFIDNFKKDMPKYVIMPKKLDVVTYKDYFANPANLIKYKKMLGLINKNYFMAKKTVMSIIYKRNTEGLNENEKFK